MFLVKNKSIIDSQYYSLISYLFKRCDMISFCLPNFGLNIVTEKNKQAFPPHTPMGLYEKNEDFDFEAYKNKVLEYMKDSGIPNYIIHEYEDVEYCESIRAYLSKIYYVSFVEDTIGFFMVSQGLFQWKYPELPEDLCFYRKGKCFLRTVAHENICEIYEDNVDEIRYLRKKLKLKLVEIKNDLLPQAKYTISY